MAQVEAAPPSPEPPPAPAPKTQLMAQVEPAPPLSRAQADTSASLPPDASPRDPEPALSPASTRPVSTAPTPQGTLLVPVEELSRLSEVAAVSAEGRMGERPQQAAATAFSTRLMPQQAPPPAAAPARAPASVPATAAQTATSPRLMPQQAPPPAAAPARPPASVPATAAQTATSPRVAAAAARTTGPLPLQGKSPWKLWAGLAGLAMLGSAGMVLWLRPDLFGIGAESAGRPGPRSAADGPSRAVPASLRSTKEKADAGDAGAMRYLGTCYANGLGVPRDVEEAKRWYRRAAEAGSQAAREELANLQRQER
jgi:localization factor PodJL